MVNSGILKTFLTTFFHSTECAVNFVNFSKRTNQTYFPIQQIHPAMSLRALLIGINDYHPNSNVRALNGCLNDVLAMQDFLFRNFRDHIPDERQIRILINKQADRQGVVAGFTEHLTLAGSEDTVLIYYSGHGSYGVTAPEFQRFGTDSQEEGWVLYDSRIPGGYDLADKEVALLLERVAISGAHVVVIADSCHSGSITRTGEDFMGWQSRYITGSRDPRPLATYLGGEYERRLAATGVLSIPDSRHFLFSACDKTELAWESDDRRGVFTKALLTALRKSGGLLSYSELFAQTCASVRTFAQKQTPRAEAMGGFNPHLGFLGQRLPEGRQHRYAVHSQQNTMSSSNTWTLELGAAQGLSSDMQETIAVEVFDQAAGGVSMGIAQLAHIGATSSLLKSNHLALDAAQTYWAVPLAMPLPPFMIYCPNRSAIEGVEAVLKNRPESPVMLCDDPAGCLLELRRESENLVLYEATGRKQLVHGVQGSGPDAAEYLVSVLDRLAHWHRILDLKNSRTRLPQWGVQMEMQVRYEANWQSIPGESVTLPFRGQKVGLRLLVHNHSGEGLYMALVYLSPFYGMKIWWSSTSKVPDGQRGLTMLEDNFFLQEGEKEEIDNLKLIVSTEPIDPTAFPSNRNLPRAMVPPDAGLQGATRSIGGLSEPDWLTKSLRIRIVREQPQTAVGNQFIVLAGGTITIGQHPVFRGNYTLETPDTGTRGGISNPLDAPFFRENPNFQLVALADTRSTGDPVFLDSTHIENDAALADHPLVIRIQQDATDDGVTLPMWFDGYHFLPVGEMTVEEEGHLEVHIRHLPEEHPTLRTRSVGKSFRLFFLKFAKEMGLPVNVQFLRWVEFLPDGKFERHKKGVREQVQAAQKVVLLVHGIIGDTKTSIPPFRQAAEKEGWLVLAFDYENLSTPIEDTALVLKKMLTEMGFAADDGKELVIIAQSMGGLVTRYFIEHLNGHLLADRVILTGTASGGTPLGNVADYLHLFGTMMGLGIKYFSWGLPPLAGLVSALQAAKKKMFVTLQQHQSDSDFIRSLDAVNPPPIPYHLVSADLHKFLENAGDLEMRDKVLRQTGRWFFQDTPNDGAVSNQSAFSVQGATHELVEGHHMRYYLDEAIWLARVKGQKQA